MDSLNNYLGPRGGTPPVVPFAGVHAGTPVIPKLYWDSYDDEQRIKLLWKVFGELADLVNQLSYYYIPTFDGDWSATKQYPPLTVVSAPAGIDGVTEGDSYTALKWVPVGTPLTDTEYWARTGNYNAQVAEVETQINQIAPFDSAPTEGSNKGVTSNGVFAAIKTEHDRAIEAETQINETLTSIQKYMLARSIEEFGCNADAEDNSAALNAALQQAADNGFILYIPMKTYNFTSPVVVPWNATLIGLSRYSSILKFNKCNGVTFDNDPTTDYKAGIGITLDNFHIVGTYEFNWDDWKNVFWNRSSESFNTIGLHGYYLTSTRISRLNIDHFGTGIYLQTPELPSGQFNTYNREYGDCRTFFDINIFHCYQGVNIENSDITFIKMSICVTFTPITCITFNHFTDLHVWLSCKGSQLGQGVYTNIYLEGAYAIHNSDDTYNASLLVLGNPNGIAAFSNVLITNDYLQSQVSDTGSNCFIQAYMPTVMSGVTINTLNNVALKQSVFNSTSTLLIMAAIQCDIDPTCPFIARGNVVGTIIAPNDTSNNAYITKGVAGYMQKFTVQQVQS